MLQYMSFPLTSRNQRQNEYNKTKNLFINLEDVCSMPVTMMIMK